MPFPRQLIASGVLGGATWVTPTDIPAAEAAALKSLYDLTNGALWTTNTNWGKTATAANWYGLSVNGALHKVEKIQLNANNLVGNITAWQPGTFTVLSTLYLYTNASLIGNMEAWAFPASYARYLYLHATGLTGDICANWTLWSALDILYLDGTPASGDMASWTFPAGLQVVQFNGSSLTGAPVFTSAVQLQYLTMHNLMLPQADVDATLLGIYNRRASFTYATPILWIDGSNAAPSGVYQYAAVPSTGKEYAYALENDDDAEGFNKWDIRYS